MQAALRHERQQAHRFEADGLAAGVRAGDDHGVSLFVEHEINGDDGVGIEQWVAGGAEFDEGAGM